MTNLIYSTRRHSFPIMAQSFSGELETDTWQRAKLTTHLRPVPGFSYTLILPEWCSAWLSTDRTSPSFIMDFTKFLHLTNTEDSFFFTAWPQYYKNLQNS
jgi:hypothetical protein